MTSEHSLDTREVIFVNLSAENAYFDLPDEVRQSADAAITVLQGNGRLAANRHKSLAGNLNGIDEIRIDDDGDTYRVYHLVQYREVIYVLDAGMKKSKKGGKIPQGQIETLVERKKAAVKDYTANQKTYEQEYKNRLNRKNAQKSEPKPQPR